MRISLIGRVTVEFDHGVIDEAQLVGRQGRLLFAYLVAEQARPVPRDELAEALWGETPPATWEKALTVLASKLRRLFAEHGVADASFLTAAFGCYRLVLPDETWVDVLEAAQAAEDGEKALAEGDFGRARERASFASSLLERPFLPGEHGAWVDAKRRDLDDVHERALAAVSDASLRAGRASEAADAAEQLITLAPLRESGYRRLMEAHVAAGNRAEALSVYERCRRLLADELGAYPSPETESLYRGLLESPVREDAARAAEVAAQADDLLRADGRAPLQGRSRTRSGRVAAVAVVTALSVTAAVLAVLALGGASGTSAPAPRVALLAHGDPDDAISAQVTEGLLRAKRTFGIETETITHDPYDARPKTVRRLMQAIDDGGFDLVLTWGGAPGTEAVAAEARAHKNTHFVYVEAPFEDLDIADVPNATAISFDVAPASRLAGFLSALVSESGRTAVIGGVPYVVENLVTGFEDGARAARPNIDFRADYSNTWGSPSLCEDLANQQIDDGFDVIFTAAGPCGLGALSAAGIRGVWGVGVDSDQSYLGPHILASVVKRFDRALELAVRRYLDGALPGGDVIELGIADDAVGVVGISPEVPTGVRKKLAEETARIRALDAAEGP
jgi:basic membrane lipoprotein Med (substrate-binding protein (PBP1-ABC) superfamily)/DNA-binding SARP family transcriptional activator